MKPLLYMRKKGLLGTAFGKHACSQRLSKSVGQFYDVNGGGGGGGTTAFVFVMRTTADNETITLPATGTNNFEIDWGDGTIETVTTVSPTHEYATAGDYTISITGQCSKWYFNNGFGFIPDREKLVSVLNLGNVGWESLIRAFYGCENLEKFVVGNSDTSAIADLEMTFRNTYSLVDVPDFYNFDVSNVVNMYYMMGDWSSMISPPDLSNFDTSNVTTMQRMMSGWPSMTTPPDLSNFDTSLVTTMQYMMYDWSSMISPPNLTGFNTSKVTNMNGTFRRWLSMTSPPDLSNFDTSLVTNMHSMMSGWSSMTSPPNLSSFDTSSVLTLQEMMVNWTSMGEIDIPIDNWNIESCTSMTSMLNGSTLTTECYDRVLIAWAAQTVQPNVVAHFGGSKYTAGGAAEASRDVLTSAPNNWTITDGGEA